jgi:hypothetical protein
MRLFLAEQIFRQWPSPATVTTFETIQIHIQHRPLPGHEKCSDYVTRLQFNSELSVITLAK